MSPRDRVTLIADCRDWPRRDAGPNGTGLPSIDRLPVLARPCPLPKLPRPSLPRRPTRALGLPRVRGALSHRRRPRTRRMRWGAPVRRSRARRGRRTRRVLEVCGPHHTVTNTGTGENVFRLWGAGRRNALLHHADLLRSCGGHAGPALRLGVAWQREINGWLLSGDRTLPDFTRHHARAACRTPKFTIAATRLALASVDEHDGFQ
jgi:hypothetical protein